MISSEILSSESFKLRPQSSVRTSLKQANGYNPSRVTTTFASTTGVQVGCSRAVLSIRQDASNFLPFTRLANLSHRRQPPVTTFHREEEDRGRDSLDARFAAQYAVHRSMTSIIGEGMWRGGAECQGYLDGSAARPVGRLPGKIPAARSLARSPRHM